MYKAIYDYLEKELDFSYHLTDNDNLFININVPLHSNIETDMNMIKNILRNTEIGKMKDEKPNGTIVEAKLVSLEQRHIVILLLKERKRKLKGITKATIKNQITMEDYKKAIYNRKSKYVTIILLIVRNII